MVAPTAKHNTPRPAPRVSCIASQGGDQGARAELGLIVVAAADFERGMANFPTRSADGLVILRDRREDNPQIYV